jgi:hypothetical protein
VAIYKRRLKKGYSWRVVIRIKGHPPICKTYDRKEEAEYHEAEFKKQIKSGQFNFLLHKNQCTFNALLDRLSEMGPSNIIVPRKILFVILTSDISKDRTLPTCRRPANELLFLTTKLLTCITVNNPTKNPSLNSALLSETCWLTKELFILIFTESIPKVISETTPLTK